MTTAPDPTVYRCRLHRVTTTDDEEWERHLELHVEDDLRLRGVIVADIAGPRSNFPQGKWKDGALLLDPRKRRGGYAVNGTADTMRGGNHNGPTARVHGIQLYDHGWTPVGDTTITLEQWQRTHGKTNDET